MAGVESCTAVCEREGGWWVITVPELESGRVTVRDLVALMTDVVPASIEVTTLPPGGSSGGCPRTDY